MATVSPLWSPTPLCESVPRRPPDAARRAGDGAGPYDRGMEDLTVLPTWAVWFVSLGGPIGAVLGVVVTNWVSRRNADETEQRSLREETMRTLRWAAELAVSPDAGRAALGVAELQALASSAMNDDEQQAFVDAALAQALDGPRSAIEAAEAAGQEAEVFFDPAPGPAKTAVVDQKGIATRPSPGVESGSDELKETLRGEEDRGGDRRPARRGEGPG